MPISSGTINSSTFFIASSTPPSGYGTTSALPLLAPAGAEAFPNPTVVTMSISSVSSPRLLKIFRAMTSSMTDDMLTAH